MCGQALAPSIAEILQPARSICVAWGRHIRSVIDGIKLLQTDSSQKDHKVAFPCWPPRLSVRPESADTIYKDHTSLDSNALAHDLNLALNGSSSSEEKTHHYLPGIDVIPFTKFPFHRDKRMPKSKVTELMKEEDRFLDELKSSLFYVESFRSIFGTPNERTSDCLLRTCDAALLPAGPREERSLSLWEKVMPAYRIVGLRLIRKVILVGRSFQRRIGRS